MSEDFLRREKCATRPMREILEALRHLIAGEHAHDDLQKLTEKSMEYLNKASAWLDDFEKNGDLQQAANVTNEITKNLHENIANKFRSGEWDDEWMEQVHRLSVVFPSPLTEKFESFMKYFYDKYHKKKK